MKRWSLWWWLPPVILGLGAAAIPPVPQYTPRSLSDKLVALRALLLVAAFAYVFLLILARVIYAMNRPPTDDPRRGFEIEISKRNSDKN